MIKSFKDLYNITAEAIKTAKEPFVRNKNSRAIESALDSAKNQKIDAEEAIEKELAVVAEGKVIDVNKILTLQETLINCDNTVDALNKLKAAFLNE